MKKDELENKNIFEDLNKIYEKMKSLEEDMLLVKSYMYNLNTEKYVVVEKTTPQPYFPPNIPYMPNGPICEIKGDTMIGPGLAPNNGGPELC